MSQVDFSDQYLYWMDPEDWSEILKEVGMGKQRRQG